jgi:NitT/TauT family transport system ATP-binding protein
LSAIGFSCISISREFPVRDRTIAALEDVSFEVAPQEFVCIVGPSGCGKSTLLRIIAGLLQPSGGEVRFAGAAPPGAPRCGLVFQEQGTLPWRSVLDNVAFGLERSGLPQRERRERALAFVERVGLGRFARALPHELSVGMRQRVAIARGFVSGAPILLMDEPFGMLDAQTRWVLQEELLRIWQADRKLVVFVTHDIEEAVLLGDRVLVMTGRPGQIREEIPIPLGRPRDLPRDQSYVSEITWHIWQLLEEQVRGELSVRD